MKSELRSKIIAWLGAFVLLYMMFFKSLRSLDVLGLASAMIICFLMIIIAGQTRFFKNLIPFYILSVLILAISLVDGMPDSWTRYRDPVAALRQWAWLPVLTLTASAIHLLVREHWRWIARNSLWLAVAIFAVTRSVRIAFGQLDNINMDFFIYGIDNENAVIVALVFIYMHYSAKSLRHAIFVGVLFLFMASSQTSLVSGIISIFALLPRLHKPVIIGLAVSGLVFIGTAQVFYRELIYIDPNSSFRGLVWRDSYQILKDTMGVGVGYGTEYIKNDFRGIDADFDRYIDESASDRLFVGTHSSLYDVAIRTGLLGVILLLTGLLRELRGYIHDQRLANLRAALVGTLLFNNFFNMGLASLSVTMGTALLFALGVFCVHRRSPVSIGYPTVIADPSHGMKHA